MTSKEFIQKKKQEVKFIMLISKIEDLQRDDLYDDEDIKYILMLKE